MQLGAVGRAGAQLLDLAVEQRGADRRDLVALREDLVGERAITLLERGETFRLAEDLGARGARRADDLRVLVADPLHEVDLLQQIFESVGVEDHADEVGRAVLVGRDEVGCERVARLLEAVLELHEPVAGGDQLILDLPQLGLAGGEFGLDAH